MDPSLYSSICDILQENEVKKLPKAYLIFDPEARLNDNLPQMQRSHPTLE